MRYAPIGEHRIDRFDGDDIERYVVSAAFGRTWFLSAGAVDLLRAAAPGGSADDVAERLGSTLGRAVDPIEVVRALKTSLVEVGLLHLESDATPDHGRGSPLAFQVSLIPAPAVQWICRWLLWMVPEGKAFWLATTCAVASAFGAVALLARVDSSASSGSIGIWAFALMVVSTLIHELGHATACAKSGARSGHIGFGIYWYFPVLYTSLDEVWRLPRWERARVDAAGVLFQATFVLAVALVVLAMPGQAGFLRGLPALFITSISFTLNPFLRFDGYWLLSDLSGIPNLRAESIAALRDAIGRRSEATDRLDRAQAARGPRVRQALAVYGASGVVIAGILAVTGLRVLTTWMERAGYQRLWLAGGDVVTALATGALLPAALSTLTVFEFAVPAILGVLLLVGSIRTTRQFIRQLSA